MACGGTLRRTMGGVIEVRLADAADLAQLPAVEAAADELFVPLGITGLPAPAPAGDRARSWRVLVAGRPVRGFAVLEQVDGAVHLEQLSVDPAYGRQGVGGALLAATVGVARESGADRVTLITYADVPWNAPFYARHGWRPAGELTAALRALRDHEAALGLDRHGTRIVMVRSTTVGQPRERAGRTHPRGPSRANTG
jgi:GNAT superfamily N-acetyltransferase